MNNILPGSILLFHILFGSVVYASESNSIKTFNSSDYSNIIKSREKTPFIMLFWSIECSPCLKEMHNISKLSKKERDQFIFIATDGHEMKQEISNVLSTLDLEKENNWVFNSNSSEAIISTIDKRWYGETPRSYYFDKNKKRSQLKNE